MIAANPQIAPLIAMAAARPVPGVQRTIFGLDSLALHHHFWASHGVQVVRQGEPSEIVSDCELYLLTDPRSLINFKMASVIEALNWIKPQVLLIRLHDDRERGYRERVITDDENRFIRVQRLYEAASDLRLARCVLTPDREVAQLWQSSPDPLNGWRRLRRYIPRHDRLTLSVDGSVFDRSLDREIALYLRDLVQTWKRPDSTITRAMAVESEVWKDPKSTIDPDARFIGSVWVGAGRHVEAGTTVIGPSIVWDNPDVRPPTEEIQWLMIEPREIPEEASVKPPTSMEVIFKRIFDIAFSLFALLITVPLYPFIIAAIWLEDGRPFFFAHRRETRNGKEFPCIKFRSMRKDAERLKAQLRAQNQADGPQFYIERDPRLTKVGLRLRRYNLDELPQFINVLLGHMSVVGPRPSPRVENQFCPAWREARLSVRPGITGLWQIHRTRRTGSDFQEWIKYDIEYVETRSWTLDIWIIFKTVFQVFRKGVALMNIRPKTKRRVSYLLIAMCLTFAVGATIYALRMRQINARIDLQRVQGMSAYNAGDYNTAYDKLSGYVHKRKHDPEALLALAISRSKVPSLDGSDITESVNIYNKYLTMAPDNDPQTIQAKHQLLQIEQQFQPYAGQAISLANSLLRDDSGDVVALKALAQIQFMEQRYKDSLNAAVQYTRLQPTDLELQRLTLALMQLTAMPPGELLERGESLAESHPTDPRFQVVQAFARRYASEPTETPEQRDADEAEETRLLLDAARHDPPDAQFVRITVNFLDRIGQLDAAQDLLSRACDKMNNPDVFGMMVERLWENDKFAEVIQRLNTLDSASPKTDPELIAFKAMSYYSLKQFPDSQRLLTALAARPDEPEAFAWSTALKAKFDSSRPDPKAQVAQYQQAAQYDSANPFIQTMLGDAYARVGETDLALQEWRQASGRVPGWAYPHIRMASLLAGMGQGAGGEAVHESQVMNSSVAAPDALKIQADIAKAQVQYAHVQATGDPAETKSLLDDVTDLQRQVPAEPNTLPIYAALLARAGHSDQAIQVIRFAQDQPDELGQEVLLKLAVVSRESKLGLEQEIYNSVQREFGMTPQLALAQASDMLAGDRGSEGLKLLQNAASTAKDQKPIWDRTLCLYRESSRDPGPPAAWKQLGDAYPQDLAVQSAIVVNQNSAWADREFMSRSIDRLKALTGDDAVTWKLGRARWLLDSPDEQKDASAAVVLLSEVIRHSPGQYRPHMLLATAYEKLADTAANPKDRQTNLANAAGEWKQSSDLMPASPEILYNLLRVLNLAGKSEEASAVFDKLGAISKLSPDMALQTATIMLEGGNLPRAQKMLEEYPHPRQQLLHDATLATVYRRQGRIAQTTQAYLKLAESDSLDAETIAHAADFFGAMHDLDQARHFLDRLPSLHLPHGQAELIEAAFDEQYISPDAAASQYAAAIKADSSDRHIAASQICFLIRVQRWAEAQSAIDAALTHWPADAQFTAEKTIAARLSVLPPNPALAPFMAEAASDPQNPAVRDAIDILAASAPPAGPEETLKKLTDLTSKYPDYEPLSDLTISRAISARHIDDAVVIAAAAMKHFTASAHAAQLAARVDAMSGHWDQAIYAAQQWRARGLQDPIEADVVIAAGLMFTGKPRDAASELSRYIPDAVSSPAQFVDLIMEYCEALIRDNHEDDAAALLHPLAEKSELFRRKWLDITSSSHHDADSALGWIERVHPLLPADSIAEQTALARTYFAIGEKYNSEKAFERSRDALRPFIGKQVMDPSTLLMLASAAAGAGDLPLAEKTSRDLLAADPKNIPAQNALAEVLSRSFDVAPLKQAETLARAACTASAADPAYPVYLNTLAVILRKQERSDEAIAALEQARLKLPNDPTILIGLADAYARSNQLDKAAQYLGQIDASVITGPPPSLIVGGELQDALSLVRKAAGSPLGEAR